MAKLVSQLILHSDDVALVEYQPGSVVCLNKAENNNWIVSWMIRPELVR
jgi:phosphohistidine phosphatase